MTTATLTKEADAMKRKAFNSHALSVKVLDDAKGIVEAYVSVFGNVDSMGEIVDYGAFTKSLARKYPKVAWSHDWTTIIGKVIKAEEVKAGDPRLPKAIKSNGGLRCEMQLNLETQAGRESFSNLKGGFVDEFSIGYVEKLTEKGNDGLHLKELDLFEVSPVLAGANPATVLVGAKSAESMEAMTVVTVTTPKAAFLAVGALIREKFVDLEDAMDAALVSHLLDAFYTCAAEVLYGYPDGDGDLDDQAATPEAQRTALADLASQLSAALKAGDGDDSAKAGRKAGRVLKGDNINNLQTIHDASHAMADSAGHDLHGDGGTTDENNGDENDDTDQEEEKGASDSAVKDGTAEVAVIDPALVSRLDDLGSRIENGTAKALAALKRLGLEVPSEIALEEGK